MTLKTLQELFDTAVKHLLTQNAKAIDSVNGYCAYRGQNGTMCAVGALWNGSSGGTRNTVDYANKKRVPVKNVWPGFERFRSEYVF